MAFLSFEVPKLNFPSFLAQGGIQALTARFVLGSQNLPEPLNEHTQYLWLISPVDLSCANYISTAGRTNREKRGNGPLSHGLTTHVGQLGQSASLLRPVLPKGQRICSSSDSAAILCPSNSIFLHSCRGRGTVGVGGNLAGC